MLGVLEAAPLRHDYSFMRGDSRQLLIPEIDTTATIATRRII
jgi:hypothetical protein